jgi:hypothetical protein
VVSVRSPNRAEVVDGDAIVAQAAIARTNKDRFLASPLDFFVRSPYALFNKLGAKTCEFRILQTVKLYLISAEINNKSKLIARLLSLLGISLGHPVALRDQVRQRSNEWEYD